ncbi:MAG: deoxyribodipyrimidine photo-lyase [Bacteroidota bacterium]|nr:DNA photolyase family protein [Candidatus Kapabacteria bacterium]MDW8272139.1 deoxyribodipyrimidine photo-lyase [Bacteroidota bacterium]
MAKPSVNIFWFRRDLRLDDNRGLQAALRAERPVLPLFIFDRNILDRLESRVDRRVVLIHRWVEELSTALREYGSSLLVEHGTPLEVFNRLVEHFDIGAVYTNRDYEPYARQRDQQVADFLHEHGIGFYTFKDQCIFEEQEILKPDGTPYTVYTPYSKAWRAKLSAADYAECSIDPYCTNFWKTSPFLLPSLEQIGFHDVPVELAPLDLSEETLRRYKQQRDYPALDATSHASVYLRFGKVSVRALVRRALELDADAWLGELIWREFFMMILANFPHVVERSFHPAYDAIVWRNDENDFRRWCEGRTGYPLVDAGMRQLNATGHLHNRVRMVVASFLTKDLLIDWRWGEAYFAEKLLDYELSSNNGNWQWAAGTGCDAAPYFRIFNPLLQQEKFDPHGDYIRRWIPELGTPDYPPPIVEHTTAKERAVAAYRHALIATGKILR